MAQPALIAGIIDKGLDIIKLALNRLFDPSTQERLYKLAIQKRKQKAIDIAERQFMSTAEMMGIIQDKANFDKDEKREWSRYKTKFKANMNRFIKYNQ